ncbi:MAG: hypothetical protein NTV30_09925 [Chloroflexi bacterium]|nr:hypothetical protein [Chloroflexota bacterium]
MYKKFVGTIRKLHLRQQGITGLETAIILIAFVTVASVLAYSVLSAGVFSAERGKETVYSGLKSAQSTVELKGTLLGLSAGGTELETVQFTLGLAVQGEKVDMDTMVMNYIDVANHNENPTWTYALSSQSTERGTSNILEGDEQIVVTFTIPVAATVDEYDWFTIQIIPSGGSTVTVKRTMPGSIEAIMNLN